MKYAIIALLGLSLAACSTLPAEAGKSDVRQNIRGGIFSAYTGGAGIRGEVAESTIAGEVDGKKVDLKVKSGSPFIVVVGDVTSDTSNTNSGSTTATQSPTNNQNPEVPVNVSGIPGQ